MWAKQVGLMQTKINGFTNREVQKSVWPQIEISVQNIFEFYISTDQSGKI